MILVVGPGRCGTSTVARLLHERLGVNMGTTFRDPDTTNPQGFYEDLSFRDLNADLLDGRVPFPQWHTRTTNMIRVRNGRRWGVKDPRLCYVLPFYLDTCEEAIVIRCQRPAAQVALSMARRYGWSVDEARAETDRRERLLDLVNHSMHNINFTERRIEDEVVGELETILK